MVDREVQDTLREIRERVLAESARAGAQSQPTTRASEAATPAVNGGPLAAHVDGRTGESLARLQANLATTERAWSRLPPLLSNRSGLIAQLELWLKRQIKRAAHWFTWEQVNFNSAVHHALGDARDALAAHDHALAQARSDVASLREQLERMRSEAEADNKARASEMSARVAAAESRFDARFAELRRALDAGVQQLRAERHAEQNALADGLRAERDARIREREEEFENEMRERVGNLLEEQRVCFRQLSLEAGESAATLDRARKQIEARIEAIEKSDE
jgi:hypothetical protein